MKRTDSIIKFFLIGSVLLLFFSCSTRSGISRNGTGSGTKSGSASQQTEPEKTAGEERTTLNKRADQLLSKLDRKKKNLKTYTMTATMKLTQTTRGDNRKKSSRTRIQLKRNDNRLLLNTKSSSNKNSRGKSVSFGSDGSVFWVKSPKGKLRKRKLTKRHRLELTKFKNMFHPFDVTSLPNANVKSTGVKVKRSSLEWSVARSGNRVILHGNQDNQNQNVEVRISINNSDELDGFRVEKRSYKLHVKAGKRSRTTNIVFSVQRLNTNPELNKGDFKPPE